MAFTLIDSGWDQVIDRAVKRDHSALRIVCPFLQRRTVERLLSRGKPERLQVITRFNVADFAAGVSDLAALRYLLDHGAQIRGIRNLHAKLYLFGDSTAIATSANLTEAALTRNHEFGFVTDEATVIAGCRDYFDRLWPQCGPDVTHDALASWETQVADAQAAAPPVPYTGLSDYGTTLALVEPADTVSAKRNSAPQAWVKLFNGREPKLREPLNASILEIVDYHGSHWACTYKKTPRSVVSGAAMYFAVKTIEGGDYTIYGRGVGKAHDPKYDLASASEIAQRDFKAEWPKYIRIRDAEFIAGELRNGISLHRLKKTLKAASFASTQANMQKGSGNLNPNHAYLSAPAVRLTRKAHDWLNARIDEAIEKHGRLSPAQLSTLDWPVRANP